VLAGIQQRVTARDAQAIVHLIERFEGLGCCQPERDPKDAGELGGGSSDGVVLARKSPVLARFSPL
jgi:hypothetical protein